MDAVVQLSFAVQGVLGGLAAEHDLSVTQLRVLAILRDREPAMLDLARHLGLEKSSVTGLIDRAERRGLVERVRAEHDGRGVRVRLTPAGHELGRVMTRKAEERLGALLGALPAADQARLGRLADVVVSAADAARATM